MICQHEEIITWYWEDTNQPSGMWSCKGCGHKFAPIKPWVVLTEEEIDKIVLDQKWEDYPTESARFLENKIKEKNT